jgi:hypothetical protein
VQVHPAAELFPPMTADELRELGEDIRENGMTSPIVLWVPDDAKKVLLLDGRNRLDALELVGIPIGFNRKEWCEGVPTSRGVPISWGVGRSIDVKYLKAPRDPYDYVLSANIHRRHLTAEQKREIVAKILKAQPEKSNRQIAKMAKVSHPHVAKVREELEATGDVETVTTSIDTKGRKQPAKRKPVAVKPEPVAGEPEVEPTTDVPDITPNPISNAWKAATADQRCEFIVAHYDEIVAEMPATFSRTAQERLKEAIWQNKRDLAFKFTEEVEQVFAYEKAMKAKRAAKWDSLGREITHDGS